MSCKLALNRSLAQSKVAMDLVQMFLENLKFKEGLKDYLH